VLTPKSLLRADAAKSSREEIRAGIFNVLLEDPEAVQKPRKLIFCSGKVAYDLFEYRRKNEIKDVMIIRLEQLYPFPFDQVTKLLNHHKDAKQIVWVQEEPRNMGGWNFVLERFQRVMPKSKRIEYAGRLPSASPAAGSFQLHHVESELFIRQAFA